MEIKTFSSVEFPENCYAVILNDGIILVDPGEFTPELENFVKLNIDKIKYILLTHMHFDHIGGIADVKALCPDAKIVIHSLEAEGLSDPVKSLAVYFGFEHKNTVADILCDDLDVLILGDTKINVLHTPGHSEGSVCYMIENSIFCGDTLFEGSCGRTDFPSGNPLILSKSLKKLKDLEGDFNLYPGHGNITTLNNERLYNPYMRKL